MKSIEVISIPVTDQQKAKEFYINLGFEVIVESSFDNGETWIQMGLPDRLTTISLVNRWPFKKKAMTAGSLHGLFLETDDLEKEIEQLNRKGIVIGIFGDDGFHPGKIDDSPWGKFAHITDPDGNALVIHQNKL